MQFLSLGLLPPQNEEGTSVEGGGVENGNGGRSAFAHAGGAPEKNADSSSLRSGPQANHSTPLGMTKEKANQSPVSGNGASEGSYQKAGSSTPQNHSQANDPALLGMTEKGGASDSTPLEMTDGRGRNDSLGMTEQKSYRWPLNPPEDGGELPAKTPTAPKQILSPALKELHERLHDSARSMKAEPLTASVDSLTPSQRGGIPTFSTFNFGYLPARGLLYSTIGHELALFALFLLFHYGFPAMRAERIIAHDNAQDHVLYLPELGGGSEGAKTPGGGPIAAPEQSAAPAHASKGFAYPGRQAILSDPRNPTNAFQTVQRPLLVNPEPIRKLVPLPNIIQMAETRLPSELLNSKAALPQLKETPKPIRVKNDFLTHRNAKFQVPVTDAPLLQSKLEMPKLPAAEAPIPEAPKVQPQPKKEEQEAEKPAPKPIKVTAEKLGEKQEREVAPPSQAQIARAEMHGKAKEPLLSLSPMPLPPNPNAKIPDGEARGRFAIAPGGTLNPNSITPGKMDIPLSTTPGMGRDKTEAANAATDSNASSGNGAGHAESGGGGTGTAKSGGAGSVEVVGNGSGNTSGEGAGGTSGTGKGGRGTSGNGAGANSGKGAGSGSGGGSGSGAGSFPGITIQGGEDASAENMNPPKFTIEQQPAYSMTVVSTAQSGGGLEDFGVFQDERVFTVYIPMKKNEEEADPTWTLQYAPVQEGSSEMVGQVLAPAVATREWPEVPAALQKKYAERQVVISAIVGKDGKVSQVAVLRTPDQRVSTPIARAFAKWIFHPAQMNNAPVAVKVLIGIPL